MLKDGNYYPTDEERAVFKRIITTVRLKPVWFVPSAAALDRDYSTQAIRDRRAAELREHRSIPNHIKRSRAYERKHCQHEALSQQLGLTVTPLEVIPSPPKRLKGVDGKPQQPDIKLRERFLFALQDTYKADLDLDVYEMQEGLDIATRRVLLAWLWRDPNRGTVQRITEFQELRNKPTKTGIGPLWIRDDAELQNCDMSRFLRKDGGIEQDAAAWIKKAQDAIDFLESQADSTRFSFPIGNDTNNSDSNLEATSGQRNNGGAVAQGGMKWQDAMKQTEEYVKAHDGAFPSVKRLAEIVGCSRRTIDKAVTNSTYLKARKAESKNKGSGRTVSLSDNAIEEASESRHAELKSLIAEQDAELDREERQAQAAKNSRP